MSPLYFRASRGPIGQLRRALKEHLPSSAFINLYFIGQITLEILCAENHKSKLTYVMNRARMSHIKGSSVLFPHAHSRRDIPSEQKQRHCLLAIERAKGLRSTLREGTAKIFFTNLTLKLEGTLESLKYSETTASTVPPRNQSS